MNKIQFEHKYQELEFKGDKRNKGRLKTTLDLFLQGDSSKEITTKINASLPSSNKPLAEATVRGDFLQIYQHFNVADQGELLDLCYQHIPEKVSLIAFERTHTALPLNIHLKNHYLERQPLEKQCQQQLFNSSSNLIRIKGLKQTGKTYLIEQYLFKIAQEKGYQTILLNFNSIDIDILEDSQKFGKWFCKKITQKLKLEDQVKDLWDDDFGMNDNCNNYFKEHILPQLKTPIILALDNLEQILPYPIAQDLPRLLRTWLDSEEEIKQKLKIIIAYSTENYHNWNIDSSPFYNLSNLLIELPEFTLAQLKLISNNMQIHLSSTELEELQTLLGGHLYLINKAFNYLTNNPDITIEQFFKKAPTQAGIYQADLLNFIIEIKKDATLLETIKQLITSHKPIQIDPIVAFKLDNMGLIKKNDNLVQIRNQLYRLYFQQNL